MTNFAITIGFILIASALIARITGVKGLSQEARTEKRKNARINLLVGVLIVFVTVAYNLYKIGDF